MRVAFVGLGTMGLPMARHLVAAGHQLVGYDLDPSRVEALGVAPATSLEDAVDGADAVLVSLPSPAAVEDVMRRVGAAAAPGTLAVDLSTSPPELSRRLARELTTLELLDAPVSGGPRGADAGTLTVMVGGAEPTFARSLPLLEAIGELVVRVGDHGAGQIAKLCNNLIAGATMVALAEACAIAEREGIPAATLYRLLTASTGDSRVLRNRFPLPGADESHPSGHGFAPLFALDLIEKDLTLGVDLAGERAAPVAEAALSAYRRAQAAGHGSLDYSAVYLTASSE